MSLRRVDPRFCLPEPVRTAVVLGELPGWSQGLAEAGVEVRSAGPADLAVAASSAGREALAKGANVILEGRGGRRLISSAGRRAQAILLRPRIDRAETLLPLGERKPVAYAISNWSAGTTRVKRARNRLAATLASNGLLPEVEPVVALGTSQDGGRLPYLVQAAIPLGVPADAGWFMTCGHGDALSRNVFQLFPPDAHQPAWVLKFARVPGYDDPFRRDERGLALAAGSGQLVASHAPQLLGRFAVDGVEASLETAATGKRLRAALLAPGPERPKLELVGRVAEWLLGVARETAGPAEALRPELDRIASDVVPTWSDRVPAELVQALPTLPAVLQHNDMGCWNIVVDDYGFTAVDWESAHRHGLPLWDLLYFLTDALVTLDDPGSPAAQDERRDASCAVSRHGRRFSSSGFGERCVISRFRPQPWARSSRSAGSTMRSHVIRAWRRSRRVGVDEAIATAPVGRLAEIWLADAALGPEWRAWHA